MVEEGSTTTRVTTEAAPMVAVVSSSATSKTGATMVCLAAENDFSCPDKGRNVIVSDVKNSLDYDFDFDSDGDSDERKVRVSNELGDEEQNLCRGFSTMNGDEK